jgi:hypothetical protein
MVLRSENCELFDKILSVKISRVEEMWQHPSFYYYYIT